MSRAMPRKLSHVDARGRVRMVDVGDKPITARVALARGRVFMHRDTLALLRDGRAPKGDVLTVAHVAGVMAAKRTAEIIPLAHSLPLDGVDLAFSFDAESSSVGIEARVRTRGRTGVEMEALTAVTVAALTLYDMLKAVDRGMVMGEFAVWEKRGGRSGVFRRRS
jgi:cyclic pyranopterin monophosphate synthase